MYGGITALTPRNHRDSAESRRFGAFSGAKNVDSQGGYTVSSRGVPFQSLEETSRTPWAKERLPALLALASALDVEVGADGEATAVEDDDDDDDEDEDVEMI